MLSSFIDLRVAHLGVCVDMQENPRSVDVSVEQLRNKIGADADFWQRLLNRSEALREPIAERETRLNDIKWPERHLPEGVGDGEPRPRENSQC